MRSRHHSAFMRSFALFACTLSFAGQSFSQVAIEKQHMQNIFTPGGFHKYSPATGGSFDIGRPGGPNIYDFTAFSLQGLSTSYNYEVSTIPTLAPRYIAGGVTFGDSPSTIEKNPVFFFRNDTMFVIGQASLSPSQRFVHYSPMEIMTKFPTVYGASISQTVSRYDTSYALDGTVTASSHATSLYVTTIDGYGTIKLTGGEYQCVRVKKEYRDYGDKDFIYLTRDGVFMVVGGVTLSAPDSGIVEGGAQLLTASTLAGVETGVELPVSSGLLQNYPNPFNPMTTISYQLASVSRVKLVVFDVLGREVKSLTDEVQTPGRYAVPFDGAGLASGVYVCRITAIPVGNDQTARPTGAGFVDQKKMLLVR